MKSKLGDLKSSIITLGGGLRPPPHARAKASHLCGHPRHLAWRGSRQSPRSNLPARDARSHSRTFWAVERSRSYGEGLEPTAPHVQQVEEQAGEEEGRVKARPHADRHCGGEHPHSGP